LELANLVHNKIAERRYYPELADTVYEAIMELGINVLEHAQAGHGFAAAQTYRLGTPAQTIVFSVGDAGIGLRQSLARSHNPASDHDALTMAVQSGISGTGDRARGYGLPTIVERAIELGGSTHITSGGATAHFDKRGQRPNDTSPMTGTLVGCRIACQPGK
jgi:hypothetical protein